MFSLAHYTVLESIYDGNKSLIFRAMDTQSQQTVIIKALKAEYPSLVDVNRLKREYEIGMGIASSRIVKPLELLPHKNGFAIVFEDFHGVSLHDYLSNGPIDLTHFLEIAIQLVEALGDLHQHKVVHKDIKPQNIIVNRKADLVKISDFGIASLLSNERQEMVSPDHLEGTLTYMSPEQTGRMNRMIDYRTDFYSLGVTFYEMLTGQLPFVSVDPVELIHGHIAKQPLPPSAIFADVPKPIDNLVMKLLCKNAEDRYQSTYGIKRDLDRSLTMLRQDGRIDDFAVGMSDKSEIFKIPEKLYGRDREVKTLLTVFDRVVAGHGELLFVSGFSGIGKSILVQEVQKSVVRERGFYVTGKFDQFKRNIPYYALIQALRELICTLLTESESSILAWKQEILQALGSNGQVMVDVIPELELLVGPQTKVQELPPVETQNRFRLSMENFIRVFTQKEHPLVMFLDDLQWADSASLYMIEYLMSDPNTSFLLLIGAYRVGEVDAAHGLSQMIEVLEWKKRKIERIELQPWQKDETLQLLSDTFQCEASQVESLSEVVMHKTNGNPFFVKQFLQSLYQEKLIEFDQVQGGWRWDLARIGRLQTTDNVVEFMRSKVKLLPEATQDVLKWAASIGNTFALQTLAACLGKSEQATMRDLWQALQEGLIEPVGTDYKFFYSKIWEEDRTVWLHDLSVTFRFLHDRVQQAAYLLISDAEKGRVHLHIGRLMLSGPGGSKVEDNLFDLVNHLNHGISLIEDLQEKETLIKLNLMAGKKAKAATAYEPALRYLRHGTDLLAQDCWQTQYALARDLYMERFEAEYLCRHFEASEDLFALLLCHVKTTLEKAEVYKTKLMIDTHQSKHQEVLQHGAEIAKLLGVKVPLKANKGTVLWYLLKTKWKLRKHQLEELSRLPIDTDPYRNEAMSILLNMNTSAYAVNQNLFVLLSLIGLNLSLAYGNNGVSGMGYGGYGMILGAIFGDYESGEKFAQIARNLELIFDVERLRGTGNYAVGSFFNHWRNPIRSSLPYLLESYQESLQGGNLILAASALLQVIHTHFFAGDPLRDVMWEVDKYYDQIKRMGFDSFRDVVMIYKAFLQSLSGAQGERLYFRYDEFDEANYQPDRETEAFGRFTFSYFKMQIHYLFDDPEMAHDFGRKTAVDLEAVFGQTYEFGYHFYHSLIRLRLYSSASKDEQKAHDKALRKSMKKLKNWEKHAPMNFTGHVRLVEAERARLSGQKQAAMDLYDEAIAAATESGNTPIVALANECASKFYLRAGKDKIARTYFLEAHYSYLKWGALAKVKELERQEMGAWLSLEAEMKRETASTAQTMMHTTESNAMSIDFTTVMRAAQAISGEIVLNKLLENMIHIVIENAGAEKGVLMMEREGALWVEAEKSLASNEVYVLQSKPFAANHEVSQSVIQYVRRMKQHVVLHDASRDGMFAKDPYIQDKQPKSILCLPILGQGKLVGVLYLENNLTTHAFTDDRLKVMNLLASQIAISIENAALFEQQVELNKAYTKFVPHQFLAFLQKNSIVDVEVGDHVQTEMTVMFSDIRSFTALSEQMTPEENFRFLNGFLHEMEPSILENNGFIDKYIGDSIMSLFDKRADDAILAGLAMLNKLVDFNARRVRYGRQPIQIGIGINSGLLMLGTIGGQHRMDSTVISDAVNLASRIEGLTKRFGVSLLISEQTFLQLENPERFLIRLLDRVHVRGKTEAVSIYEVFDADPSEVSQGKSSTKELFEEAVVCFQNRQYQRAKEKFTACWEQNREDRSAWLYVERCVHVLQYGDDLTWAGGVS